MDSVDVQLFSKTTTGEYYDDTGEVWVCWKSITVTSPVQQHVRNVQGTNKVQTTEIDEMVNIYPSPNYTKYNLELS